MRALDKARFWFLDYVFAVRWQVRGMLDRTDPKRYLDGDKVPIVLLPGIWETWHFLRPLAEHLHAAGHPVHVLAALGWNGGTVDGASSLVQTYLREQDLADAVLVAHSKGGLIGKWTMLFGDPDRRILRMVAIVTPFSGSRYAPYLPLASLRAFSPKDPTTVRLGADHAVNDRITSIYGVFDPHIPGGSALPGATNIQLPVTGHFRILADPRTLDAMDIALSQPV
jgi:hypothetical protein